MNYETKLIKISNLKINSENPRFETVENQREAITSIIENQKEKLIRLGDDIIEYGLNPADLIIVTPDLNDKNTLDTLLPYFVKQVSSTEILFFNKHIGIVFFTISIHFD